MSESAKSKDGRKAASAGQLWLRLPVWFARRCTTP